MVMVSVDVPPGRMNCGLKDLLITGGTTGPKVILNVALPAKSPNSFHNGVGTNNPANVAELL